MVSIADAMIAEEEGFSPTAFRDNTQYSIGFGTATQDPNEIEGTGLINEEEAYRRLSAWTESDRAYINKVGEREGVKWNDNELDALTSFTYNTGRGNLEKLVSGRGIDEISSMITAYNKSNGEVLDGLTSRREREKALFDKPVTEVASQPYDVADRSYLDYQEAGVPAEVLRAPVGEVGSDKSLGELWDAATYRNWVADSLGRTADLSKDKEDLNYKVSVDELSKYNDKGYSESDLQFLSLATSQENMTHRVERVEADKQAKLILEQGGVEGVGMEMLASVVDPVLLPTLFLGGVGAAGKFRSIKAIGQSMLSGSTQSVAAEYLLKSGDTQRTDADLMLAAAGGAIFSGAITASTFGIKSIASRVSRANEIEAENLTSLKDAMVGNEYSKADAALATEVSNATERKTFLTEKDIISRLQEETGTMSDTLSATKIKNLKKDFSSYRKGQELKIEAMKASKIRPSAKLKQIKQLQDSIDNRKLSLDIQIEENNKVLASNSKLSALQQGKVPESLKGRYAELKMESGEFDHATPTTDTASLPKRSPVIEPTETPEAAGGGDDVQSMGAMATRREFKDIATYDNLLPDTEVEEISNAVYHASLLGHETPRISRLATSAKGLRSTSSVIDTAPDNATRGMGIQLLDNGTRTISGHQSAEAIADALFHRNVPDYLSYEDAFDRYAKSNGVSLLGRGRGEMQDEFNKQIVLAQSRGEVTSNVESPEDSPIIAAAKARSRIYERSLKNNKDNKVIGFANVEHSHSYHSVVFDADNILSAKVAGSTSTAHADNVIDVIAKSYQNGAIKLSRENAIRLAETQVSRVFSYRHGNNGTFKKVMSESEYKLLDAELEKNGVDITVREEIKSSLFNQEDLATMSPRAMFSLRPDLTSTSGGLRVVDLIDTGMTRVMKYASDAAANSGLARHGYYSRNQFLHSIEEARQQSMNELRKSIAHPNKRIADKAKSELAKVTDGEYAGLLDDSLKLIYKEPLSSSSDAIDDISKILRKQTSITRLRSTGLMSLPEYAIAAARNGGISVLSQLPNARYFDLRSKSIEKDKFMKEFSEVFASTGHQEYLFGHKFYNNSEFDDATKSKLGSTINKVQGKLMNVTMTVNAFRSIQHGGEEVVARSIVSNISSMAKSGKITSNVRKSLMDVGGLSEDQVNEMIKHFNSSDADVFNSVKQMSPELNTALATAVRRTISGSFMRMGIGETVPYANREIGKVMTSLLNFSIGSWEKMVVRGIKSDGLGLMATMVAGQTALATMSLYAYAYSRASAMEGKKRTDYLDKTLSDDGLFWGIVNRVGFLAAPMIPMQILASARLLPEEITSSPTKTGVSSMGIPSVEMGADYFKSFGSAGSLISNKYNDEYMSNKEREAHLGNIKRVLPWIDSPVYNAATGILD